MDGSSVGKTIIYAGIAIVLFGAIILLFSRLGLRGAPLPGDMVVKKPGIVFYFPIITSIVISIILSLVLWLVSVFRR